MNIVSIDNVWYILFVPGAPAHPSIPINKKPNMVGKPGETGQNWSGNAEWYLIFLPETQFEEHSSVYFSEINSCWFLFPCFASDKVNNFKQTDKLPILKPKVPPATAKPTKQERKQTTTFAPTTAGMKIFTSFSTDALKTSILFLLTKRAAVKTYPNKLAVLLFKLVSHLAPENVILGWFLSAFLGGRRRQVSSHASILKNKRFCRKTVKKKK